NKVFIVVSEGLRNSDGKFITEVEKQAHDKFGHAQLGGVGSYLKNLIIQAGITSRVKSLELGVLQRCAIHCASDIDLEEAFEAGYSALKFALDGNSGYMVGIKRESNSPYKSSHFLVDADKIANNVKYFPKELINDEGNHIKEEALEYF
ncbi:6-phosphofructokinase, partial [Clostridium perfringens]|nr:6-phosphofructokinase [Clostridium perfringens]